MIDGLTSLRVEGFASLRDVTLEPGRLTVLIGANGSGKSNLLRTLKLAPRLRTKSLQTLVGDVGGAASLLHYGPKRTKEVGIELTFRQSDRENRYAARLGFAAGDKLLFLDESVAFRRGAANDVEPRWHSLGAGHWESVLEDEKKHATARSVSWWLARMTFFHFHDTTATSALRTHARAEDDRFLRSDGSNLAAYLARLARSDAVSDRAAWKRINQLVRRVAPCVKQLDPTLHRAMSGQGESARLDWIDDRDEQFGAHHLSDGTLRAIAMITALAQPTDRLPRFISIDEPELGLHPGALTLVAGLARSVSHRCQILFATQSTRFLDEFQPDEVVVVEREHGESKLHRLDSPTLAAWLEEYRLSEVFDKGVIGGQP